MQIAIENYRKEQKPLIDEWWKASGEMGPVDFMMPEESSFVLSIDGEPAMAITLILTNTALGWVDNAIQNPLLKKENGRVKSFERLIAHCEEFCRNRGRSYLFCMSVTKVTGRRYRQIGFMNTSENVATWVKEIK